MKISIKLLLLMCLMACNKSNEKPLLYQVSTQDFAITIPAKGEFFAANATSITAPISRSGAQVLSWLAPEFSFVKKGQVVAKFDGEVMSKRYQEKQNELGMTLQDIDDKTSQLDKERGEITKDISIVGDEKAFAEKFAIEDERILSKLEILESMQDSAYLGTKQEYLGWKEQSFSASSSGQMGLLDMKKQQHLDKLSMLKDGLAKLEIKAPHDGMMVYSSNWRGEKSRPGQTVWPGRKIAELPDVSEMKAKLHVAESEAIELSKGQQVTLTLNADATKSFQGTVDSIAAYPNSIRRGDPQKFFEVIVKMAQQQPELFIPGSKLRAQIHVKESEAKVVVPVQSVFSKDNQYYVYLYEKGEFIKRKVELGTSSLSHAEIKSGLNVGQQISLIDREAS